MKSISNIINNICKQWCILIIGLLCLTGCSVKPEFSMEGFQTEIFQIEEVQTEGETLTFAEGTQIEKQESRSGSETIQVFVCGAVKVSDVYQLPREARVRDAIEAAGGFSEDADKEWLNLAAVLQDGEKLYIYTVEETSEMKIAQEYFGMETSVDGTSGFLEAEEKINLNTATKELLMTLPGIGEMRAEAVIAYRKEKGGFDTIEEIMNISGIKEAVFLKIKDSIVV